MSRGFASMSPERRKAVSASGGRAKTTKPRGIGTLSPERRREIARMGVRARAARRNRT